MMLQGAEGERTLSSKWATWGTLFWRKSQLHQGKKSWDLFNKSLRIHNSVRVLVWWNKTLILVAILTSRIHDLNFCLLLRLLFFRYHNDWALTAIEHPGARNAEATAVKDRHTCLKISSKMPASIVSVEEYPDCHHQGSSLHMVPWFF